MLSAAEKSMRGTIAVATRWAKTPNRNAAMQPVWDGRERWFELQVDPELRLDPVVRAKLMASLKKAHYTRLAFLRSKKQRRQREKNSATVHPTAADMEEPDGARRPRPAE